MSTAVPPPSPPRPPKYAPKDPQSPLSLGRTVPRHRSSPGTTMYRFAVQQPRKNPLLLWQEGMRISRSHFPSRGEEHAAVVLEAISAAPKPPPVSPSCPPVFRLVDHFPPPPSDQVTLTQYSRHRCSSLLPLALARKQLCPAPTSLPPQPQFGPLLPRTSHPAAAATIQVVAPSASPPDFSETFQLPALRQQPRKRKFTVFFNTTSQLGTNENPCTAK